MREISVKFPLLFLFYNFVCIFYMETITISKFYAEIIFDFCIILVASLEHMFFSIYCSSSLENDHCKKDRNLGQKKKNELKLRSFNNHYKYCSCGFFLFFSFTNLLNLYFCIVAKHWHCIHDTTSVPIFLDIKKHQKCLFILVKILN